MAEPPRTVDSESLAKVEATITTELDRLAELDSLTEDDLEAFRQSLPTDPLLAELVQKALPYPWSVVFEYVEASDHLPAHWRTTPDRGAIRSEADREHKQRFAEAAREAAGLEGTVEYDGREIPKSAAHVAETISGETAAPARASGPGRRALRRLRELLGG